MTETQRPLSEQFQEVRWGIIGCGDVTEVKSGPAFNKVPHSRLVAVMRRDAAKAEDYARRHRVPRWYAHANALLADPEVNAVYIATPPDTHLHYARLALKAGKPVYLEKPMTRDHAEAEALCWLAEGKQLSVAHYRREQPLFRKIKSLLDEGAIGRVGLVELRFTQSYVPKPGFNWRLDPAISGGGLFHDLAPHQLDLMRYFFGSPHAASGLSGNTGGHYRADDTVSGQIRFSQGLLFTGSWCFSYPEKRDECRIIGSEGTLSFSVFEQKPLVLTRGGQVEEFSFAPLEHVQQPMIEAVVRYFRGEGPNPCPAAEGAEVMQLIDRFTTG